MTRGRKAVTANKGSNKGVAKKGTAAKAGQEVTPPTNNNTVEDGHVKKAAKKGPAAEAGHEVTSRTISESRSASGINTSTNANQSVCQICSLNDTGEWVVQCDDCDRFYHYNCIGFEETSPDDPWSCPECVQQVLTSTARSNDRSEVIPATGDQTIESQPLDRTSYIEVPNETGSASIEAQFRAERLALRNQYNQNYLNLLKTYKVDDEGQFIRVRPSNVITVQADIHRDSDTVAKKDGSSGNAKASRKLSGHTGSSVSSKQSKATSRASSSASQRRREIEIQKIQEEYELQTKIDEEKLALERKALELKELREKKLMDSKFRAMEDSASVDDGSSVSSKTFVGTNQSSKRSAVSKKSVHSELVSSWIQGQRNQNYQQETTEDVDQSFVANTLGVNISVPVNKKELKQLYQLPTGSSQRHEIQTKSADMNRTFSIDKNVQFPMPSAGVNDWYPWNQNKQTSHTYDGRVNKMSIVNGQSQNTHRNDGPIHTRSSGNPSGQPSQAVNANNRVSWNLNNRMSNQQSTRIHNDGTNPVSAIQIDGSQIYNGNIQLTPNQIAARHSMPKELPVFNGNPSEWPQFIKRYENTTSLCGFSDSENLERLNKCLREPARGIVDSQLIMPECVSEIIETLREKFGRPELIAKATLSKVRAEPPIKQEKLEALADFGYKVRNACNVIESMGLHYYLYSPELITDVIKKLPYQTKIEWARQAESIQANGSQINLRMIAEWLHKLSRTLNQITTIDLESWPSERKSERKADNVRGGYLNFHDGKSTSSGAQQGNSKCVSCQKECKNLWECMKFKALSVDERWKVVLDHKLCRQCLQKHGRSCTNSKFRSCGVSGCELKHNSLLHNNERHSKFINEKSTSDGKNSKHGNGSGQSNDKQSSNSTVVIPKPSNTHLVISDTELFRIVPVILHNNGNSVETFAFLDEGSSYTLMEKDTANQLNVTGTDETICLLWTNGIHRREESIKVNLEISGVNDKCVKHQLRSVNVVEDLGLSPQSVDPEVLKKRFGYLKGIPLQHYSNAIPTILIGLRHIRLTTPLETVEGDENEPIASRSRLGWSVYGPTDGNITFGYAHHHKVKKCPCSERDDDLHQIVKEHFSIENFGVSINSMDMDSKENQKALEMLKKFTVRKGKRFETRLLWKNEAYVLPDSYGMARKRLTCVENKGTEVVKIINEIIADYLAKGYATKLAPADLEQSHPRTFYLPIFTVTNPKKPGKIRPVFDAAATVRGTSLNSTLLTGPDLLSPLVDVLRRFREHQIGISGDIKEMFYRVLMNEDDRHSQRFLWRNGDKSREPDVYQFNVMTFGATCSPSSAQFVKNVNASEYEVEYPRAAKSIIENHYVDDMLDGASSVGEAIQLINDVKFVHSQAGFEIRNFKSNSKEVLTAIGETIETNTVDLMDGNTTIERVLGMFWETTSDCFMFSLKYAKLSQESLNGKVMPTKRQLLSLVMSLFDPLGLISYYVIHAKTLLQDVWRSRIGWDEKLPANLEEKWSRWIGLLPSVEQLKVPRWYSTKLEAETKIELHVFVDAGDEAFAAVAYLRFINEGSAECSLVGSKARVTPLKYLSIPRKELMGAVLGSRLVNSVANGLSLKVDRRIIWSDSVTVLTWLHSEHKKYSQFVAHRVGEILENTNLTEWRWVPSKQNVADEATKWSKKPTFEVSDRWFTGPQFLQRPESEWPIPRSIIPNSTTEEMKYSCSHSRLVISPIVNAADFSTWQRVVKAVANAKRISAWMVAKQRKLERPTLKLSREDLLDAERRLIRQAQWEGFTEEMVILTRNQSAGPKRKKPIDNGSSIRDCLPYLDEFGILRVKGRIDSATAVTLDAKRPIILPRNNSITKLIVQSYHVKFKHQNHETVVNELRQRFYIPQIRTVLKSVRWNCKLCALRRCKPQSPQMADLPAIRFEAGVRPFTFTGIDYFGPMKVKVGRQSHKRWGVIYTCLTIRAIWIDVVPSYDTEACILSIRDFVNRKGAVQEFYTDNGTNFKGADNELTCEMQKIDFQRLSNEFTSCYTKWMFNPPACPHMGGMWERLIRSVKASLNESMMTRTPTDQTLRSWLIEAENIVNSRPLTFVPLDSEDDEALTPNHFMLGSSNGMKPPGKFESNGPYLRHQWKEVQRCTNMFWKRFILEYVPTLVRGTKWFDPVKPLEVGDIVISFDESAPRNTYTRARVVETIIGTNQQVRRAKVQFGNGSTLWRPANKLGLLDVNPSPTTPTVDEGFDHLKDDKNRGENVGAAIPIDDLKMNSSSVTRSVRSVRR